VLCLPALAPPLAGTAHVLPAARLPEPAARHARASPVFAGLLPPVRAPPLEN